MSLFLYQISILGLDWLIYDYLTPDGEKTKSVFTGLGTITHELQPSQPAYAAILPFAALSCIVLLLVVAVTLIQTFGEMFCVVVLDEN